MIKNKTADATVFCRILNELFGEIYKAISHCQRVFPSDLEAIESNIKMYMSACRKRLKINILPKLHFMEDHCLDWIKKYGVGLGLFSEQGGEQLHKTIILLEIQSHGIANEDTKMLTVMRKHLAKVTPELLVIILEIRKR